MKHYVVIFILCTVSFMTVQAQQPKCNGKDLIVSLSKGTLNKVKPTETQAKVKAKLPCFTGETEDGAGFNYNGGIFYLKHDFFFYTFYDFIEIRNEFKGKFDKFNPLGASSETIIKELGTPTVKEEFYWLYKQKYGTLRLDIDEEGNCFELAIHAKSVDEVKKFMDEQH